MTSKRELGRDLTMKRERVQQKRKVHSKSGNFQVRKRLINLKTEISEVVTHLLVRTRAEVRMIVDVENTATIDLEISVNLIITSRVIDTIEGGAVTATTIIRFHLLTGIVITTVVKVRGADLLKAILDTKESNILVSVTTIRTSDLVSSLCGERNNTNNHLGMKTVTSTSNGVLIDMVVSQGSLDTAKISRKKFLLARSTLTLSKTKGELKKG
jgi:hypothetical protein